MYLRSDSAGYQQDLLLYCGEGKDARFGVIEFAVSADVTEEFRNAARAVADADWQPLYRTVEGQRYKTDQEFAEVCFVPAWAGHSRRRADYRFLAIREPLRQLDLADAAQLPFPTAEFATTLQAVRHRHQPHAAWRSGDLVAARTLRQERGGPCGHEDRSGRRSDAERAVRGQRRVVDGHDPGPQPECRDEAAGAGAGVGRRMKVLRFSLINLPGRIIRHGRRLIIRVVGAGETLALLLSARRTILALVVAPSG